MATFFFGNGVDATGKPIKTGDNSFTGTVTLNGKTNPIDGTFDKQVYDVESGTELDIVLSSEFDSGTIELNIVEGYKFTGVNFPYTATFTDNTVSYYFPVGGDELDPNSGINRYYIANTAPIGGAGPEPSPTFFFGNDVDATGKPIRTGDNSFTGTVTLNGGINPIDGTFNKQVFDVESGTELDIVLSSEFDSGTIELNIVEGYKFTGVNFPYTATFTDNTVSYDFPVGGDELDPNGGINRYYIANTAPTGGVGPEPSDEPETLANNYLVTKEELAEFNKQVYSISDYEGTINAKTLLTDYISAIRLYPFKLPPDNLYNRGNIRIGREELNIATVINSDIITINLGNINIPRTYNNALDFINVKPDLILPFCNGSISIDPEYILGSTVNIQMEINIINGATTINLTSDKVDGIFSVSNTTIGSDYPLYVSANVAQKAFEPNQAINNILTAYVIVESPIYTTSLIKSRKEGLLTDIKGDVIVDDIKLNVLATSDEKAELITLLKNGVFIK